MKLRFFLRNFKFRFISRIEDTRRVKTFFLVEKIALVVKRNISLDKECSESKVKVWAGEELQDEKLLVKINETLELESEKSKKELLKDEILSLFSIVEDVKDIISKKEHNIRLNDLKKELTKKTFQRDS